MLLPTGFLSPLCPFPSLALAPQGSASHWGWILCKAPSLGPAASLLQAHHPLLLRLPVPQAPTLDTLLPQSLRGAPCSKVLAVPERAPGVLLRGLVSGQLARGDRGSPALCCRLGWAARAMPRPCRPSAPPAGTASAWTATLPVRTATRAGGPRTHGGGTPTQPPPLLPQRDPLWGLPHPLLQQTRSSGLGD